jgi:peptidoglycan/LPS O-acetylase OafA/YrhL
MPADHERAAYYPTLDGWRAIAILCVIADHVLHGAWHAAGAEHTLIQLGLGTHGVNIFFAISGFLITGRLIAERGRTGQESLRDFYRRRVVRLLPAAAAYVAAITLLGLLGLIAVSGTELTAVGLLYRNYLPAILAGGAGLYTSHFWSLCVEEHFYLLWPAVLRWSRIAVALLLAALGALAVVWWRQHALALDVAAVGHVRPGYFVETGTRLDALLVGACGALALATAPGERLLRRLASPMTWVILAGALFEVMAAYHQRPTIWESVLWTLLVIGTVVAPAGGLGRLLEWPALTWLGKRSYSVYLWQQLFTVPVLAGAGLGVLQRWPLNVLCAVGAAAASYRWMERPVLARWGAPRPTAAATAAAEITAAV